jgi:hypothetical protein
MQLKQLLAIPLTMETRWSSEVATAIENLIITVPGLTTDALVQVLRWAQANDVYYDCNTGELLTACIDEMIQRLPR